MSDTNAPETRPIQMQLVIPGLCGCPLVFQADGERAKSDEHGWAFSAEELDGLMHHLRDAVLEGYGTMLEQRIKRADELGVSVTACETTTEAAPRPTKPH